MQRRGGLRKVECEGRRDTGLGKASPRCGDEGDEDRATILVF
jgi:hypothetical protein